MLNRCVAWIKDWIIGPLNVVAGIRDWMLNVFAWIRDWIMGPVNVVVGVD